MLNGVFFDLDGTLADTAPDFARALNRLRAEHNRPALPLETIRAQVSHGARALVTLGFELEPGDPGFDARLQQLLDYYHAHLDVETRLFPGMAEVLDYLEHGAMAWGVVTNKPRRYAEPVLRGLDLHERVGALVCPDDVTERKPHPESLYRACEQAGIASPTTCLYAGDHVRDIEAGHRAGMTTLACAFGYISAADDPAGWAADHLVGSAHEIIPLLHDLGAHHEP